MYRNYNILTVSSFFILCVAMLMVGCRCDTTRLPMYVDINSALALSGENRAELQKVLDYYKKETPDPLKLKAAKYLISNMVAYYSIAGKTMDRLKQDIDTTFRDQPNAIKLFLYLIAARIATDHGDYLVEYDLHKVTSDYLIKNIEYSFGIWADIKNHYDIPPEDFFEYVLPYRVNNEPLTEWKDSAYYYLYDFHKGKNMGLNLNNYRVYILNKVPNSYTFQLQMSQLSDSLFKQYAFDCIDRAYFDQITGRIFGVPVAVDFVPHYPTIENRHYWTIVNDQRHLNSLSSVSGVPPYTAKVYRKVSFINPIPEDNDNFVPRFIRDPYKMDVTEKYENVAKLEYKFNSLKSKPKYGYLCVFNNLAWNEVAWSEIRRGKVIFEKIGRDVIYMPCYYDGYNQIFADYPQWVLSNGEVKPLVPDKNRLQSLRLNRKFTPNLAGDYFGSTIMGVQLYATNDLSRKPYDSLAMIRHFNHMAFDTIHTNTTRKYKYWMLQKTRDRNPEFASVKFMQNGAILTAVSTFSVDTSGRANRDGIHPQWMFNDDLLDYGVLSTMCGVEFEQPVSVDIVKYITRNDKNGVYPGDSYELLYFDKGAWVSLGEKVATADYIEYDNVPSGALYWLRNRTEGKEERPFTVTDGRVRFW